ncbi:MAG: YchJ family metal-binding protein [Mycobacteriales bacterium]|nr:YchJ family metal-binding protein [Mycobacteriales bacterium]
MSPCPCGLPALLDDCCGRVHGGAPAPTAELLMRSRYSAFAVADAAYLLRSWHPSTRPRSLELDPGQEWQRLIVLECTRGGLLDVEGTVSFVARYELHGTPGAVRETSRFSRHDGRWVYLDAV